MTAIVEEERALAPSRAAARKSVVDTWLEPIPKFAAPSLSDVEERIYDVVNAALRRYAEKHFDAAWPAEKKD